MGRGGGSVANMLITTKSQQVCKSMAFYILFCKSELFHNEIFKDFKEEVVFFAYISSV